MPHAIHSANCQYTTFIYARTHRDEEIQWQAHKPPEQPTFIYLYTFLFVGEKYKQNNFFSPRSTFPYHHDYDKEICGHI